MKFPDLFGKAKLQDFEKRFETLEKSISHQFTKTDTLVASLKEYFRKLEKSKNDEKQRTNVIDKLKLLINGQIAELVKKEVERTCIGCLIKKDGCYRRMTNFEQQLKRQKA
jgi:5'-deoxynucleotidase YfbR-like HD superfamily hydrolase